MPLSASHQRPAPSARLRSTDCAARASRSARPPWPNEVVDEGEEFDGVRIDFKASEAQHTIAWATAELPLGTQRAVVKVGCRSPRRRRSQGPRPRKLPQQPGSWVPSSSACDSRSKPVAVLRKHDLIEPILRHLALLIVAMRCPVPSRSRSIVIVLVDLDVVVDLDGDGDVDNDAT